MAILTISETLNLDFKNILVNEYHLNFLKWTTHGLQNCQNGHFSDFRCAKINFTENMSGVSKILKFLFCAPAKILSLVIYPPEWHWRHSQQNGVIVENGAILNRMTPLKKNGAILGGRWPGYIMGFLPFF